MEKFKIGDRVIVINILGGKGTIVTKPTKILDDICYGIEFDWKELNKVFNPYYVNEDYIENLEDYE